MDDVLTSAANLARMAADLTNNAGIISISASFGEGKVHLTERMFHELFAAWDSYTPEKSEYVYHIHKVGGVKVFCLADKEAPNV